MYLWSWIAAAGFCTCSKLSAPPIFMLFARTITAEQKKTTTCDSFAPYFCISILSYCESTKKLLKTILHLLLLSTAITLVNVYVDLLVPAIRHIHLPVWLSSTAEPRSWKCSKTFPQTILLILLFQITKTCRALVWALLAIFTTWLVLHRSQQGRKPSRDRSLYSP